MHHFLVYPSKAAPSFLSLSLRLATLPPMGNNIFNLLSYASTVMYSVGGQSMAAVHTKVNGTKAEAEALQRYAI